MHSPDAFLYGYAYDSDLGYGRVRGRFGFGSGLDLRYLPLREGLVIGSLL